MEPTSKKIRNKGKITTALSASALRPSDTVLQASTRWTINCSAPWDDITMTVPPMTPIQRLNGGPSKNFHHDVPGGGIAFSQCSLPACAAFENTAPIPPSTSVGM